MSTIYIRDLVVEGVHGWHDHEKNKPQKFSISVELDVETKAGQSDQLHDTVNWSEIRDQITSTVEGNSFNLIEKLAQTIADELLQDHKIKKATVAVDKLEAFASGVPGVRVTSS